MAVKLGRALQHEAHAGSFENFQGLDQLVNFMVLLITTEIYLISSKHNFSTLVAKFGGEQMGEIVSMNMIQLQISASSVLSCDYCVTVV